MKKVLFLMLAMVIGITAASAQEKVAYKKGDMYKASVTTTMPQLMGREVAPAMNFANGEVMTLVGRHDQSKEAGYEQWETMQTFYDLQSNSCIGDRIAVWPDGTVAAVATWGNDGSGYSNRASGYNYYDGSDFGDMPEEGIESIYSGWPTIAPLGDGEILASHGNNNVNVVKRTVKGEGSWDNVVTFNNWTWPRVGTTHDGQYVHMVFADQDSGNTLLNYVKYVRSTDGGQTWSEVANPPEVDVEGMYRNDIGADDYIIATNGDRIAILFAGCFYDLFYIYSEDNGETWSKQIVYNYPYDHSIDWNNYSYNSSTDTIWAVDNSASIAIANDGTVHVAFGLGRFSPSADEQGRYSYWPFTDGIVYWNSNYTNEQGRHEIPNFGDWSGDANLEATYGYNFSNNGVNGISNTLNDDRLWSLAEADGFRNLCIFTPDEDHDGTLGYTTEIWGNNWGSYRTYGIATMPAISIDESGHVMIAYSVLSETRLAYTVTNNVQFYQRNVMITTTNGEGEWYYDAINLQDNFEHSGDEAYSVTACSTGNTYEYWLSYSADPVFGLFLDKPTDLTGYDGQLEMNLNSIWVVKVNTDFDAVPESINPMTSARVYPNPVNGVLNVEVNASQNSEATMSVFNIMGQKVAEKTANFNTGINTASFNTSELSNGVYFVTVKANGFEKTMKFVVK